MVKGISSNDILTLKRLDSLGLKPEQYMPILREIDGWVRNSGEEWTVGRLKDLRDAFLHFVAGLPIDRRRWIAYHRDGTPKGAFRVLWRRNLTSSELMRAWNVLMLYTRFSSALITRKQWAKFTKGVRRGPANPEGLATARKFVLLGIESLRDRLGGLPAPECKGDPLMFYEYSSERRSPLGIRPNNGSRPQDETLIDSILFLSRNPDFGQLCPNIISGTLEGLQELWNQCVIRDMSWGITLMQSSTIGRVACVQERGYKARFIANPGIAFQAAFGPLFRWLAAIVSRLPGNYQFDQSGGRVRFQQLLRERGYAHSVDLSGATDNAPLELQVEILRVLGVEQEWISLLEICCRGKWHVPREILDHEDSWFTYDGKPLYRPLKEGGLSWTVGTPLGLKPTFHLFSLWHGLLLEGISYYHRNSDFTYVPGQDYVFVGDDVGLFSEEMSNVYTSVMADLGIPVSQEKSLLSDSFGEFTSRLITPSRIIDAPKWGPLDDDTFYDIARAYGPVFSRVLRWRQRRVLWLLGEVPEEFGGMGWNYQGRPWYDRARPFLDYQHRVSATELTSAGARLMGLGSKSKLIAQHGFSTINYDVETDFQSERSLNEELYGPYSVGIVDAFRQNTADTLARLRDIVSRAEAERIGIHAIGGELPRHLVQEYNLHLPQYGEIGAVRAILERIELMSRYVSGRVPRKPLSTLQQLENLIKDVNLG